MGSHSSAAELLEQVRFWLHGHRLPDRAELLEFLADLVPVLQEMSSSEERFVVDEEVYKNLLVSKQKLEYMIIESPCKEAESVVVVINKSVSALPFTMNPEAEGGFDEQEEGGDPGFD